MVTIVQGTIKKEPDERQISSTSSIPRWKHGSGRDTAVQPTPPTPQETPLQDKQTYTKPQLQQQTAVEYGRTLRDYVLQRNLSQMRQRAIKPNEQYVMQTEGTTTHGAVRGWSKGQILTGQQIQEIYKGEERQYGGQSAEYRKQLGKDLKTIQGYPKGTTFTQTDEGYQVNIPETEQLRFSEKAIEQRERLPPGIRELSLTGFYFGSNIAAIGKGVADFLGIGRYYDVGVAWQFKPPGGGAKEFTELVTAQKYGVRYTSWGAYLPGGIKGETKLLEKHPIEAAVGNIGAEAVQWWAGGKIATMGTQKLLIPAFSRGVSKIPVYSTRFTRALPLAPYSGRFIGKIGGTTVGRNIGLFSKGYRPAYVIGAGTSKVANEVFDVGTGVTRKVTTQTTPYTLKLSRTFLSPENYKKAMEELTKKMSTKTIDIGFPSMKQVGRESFIVGNVIKKSYGTKGLFKKTLVESNIYDTFRRKALSIESKPVASAPSQYGSLYRLGKIEYGAFRFDKSGLKTLGVSRNIPALESEVVQPFQKKFYEAQKMWGKIPYGSEIEPKAWLEQGIRKPRGFIRNTEAAQSLILSLERTQKPRWSPRNIRQPSMILPESNLYFQPIIQTGVLGARLGEMKWSYEQRGQQIPEVMQLQTPMSTRVYGGLPAQAMQRMQQQLQIQDRTLKQLITPELIQQRAQKQKLQTPMQPMTTYMKQPPRLPILFPAPGMGGGIIAGPSGDIWESYFRKREFNIGNLQNIFGFPSAPRKKRRRR